MEVVLVINGARFVIGGLTPAEAALLLPVAWRGAGRFADWFTAERGVGPGKNGWV